MVISRQTRKIIEYHLFNAAEEKQQYEELIETVANKSSYDIEPTGIRSTNGSADNVGDMAITLDKIGEDLRKWIKVVDQTKNRFKSTTRGKLIELFYDRKYNPVKVQMLLYISEGTFFYWKTDIITYATIKAIEYGLISID